MYNTIKELWKNTYIKISFLKYSEKEKSFDGGDILLGIKMNFKVTVIKNFNTRR